jgi:hypothetical protein
MSRTVVPGGVHGDDFRPRVEKKQREGKCEREMRIRKRMSEAWFLSPLEELRRRRQHESQRRPTADSSPASCFQLQEEDK